MNMTSEDRALAHCLEEKITEFRHWNEPYVWRMRLSQSDFECIEDAIEQSIESHDGSVEHLLTSDYAAHLMVYVAEWYKRCYPGDDRHTTIDKIRGRAREIWENTGFSNWESYVYRSQEGVGNRQWQYSMWVLGGLATKFIIRKQKSLIALCRILHEEDVSPDELNLEGAISYKQSIRQNHSLFHYINAVLSETDRPFSDEDLADGNSVANQLMEAIRAADAKALKNKFRFEWIFRNAPSYKHISRSLKVSLLPEENGQYHEMLSYSRLRHWGIEDPAAVETVKVALRFKNGDAIVQDVDFSHPLMTFDRSGDAEVGFIAGMPRDYAIEKRIPVVPFTKVEILTEIKGESIPVQDAESYDEIKQLYRTNSYSNEWTSTVRRQADTAVIFPRQWSKIEGNCQLEQKTIFNPSPAPGQPSESEPYTWCYLIDQLKIECEGRDKTFYNRSGYNTVECVTFPSDVAYGPSKTVTRYYQDETDDSEEEFEQQEEPIQVLFGIRNLKCYHKEDENKEWKEIKPDWMEVKVGGRWSDEFDEMDLQQGVQEFRLSVGHNVIKKRVFYVPFTDENSQPVVRNFDDHSVNVVGESCNDDYEQDFVTHFESTIPVKLGSETDYIIIPVYRPQRVRELWRNDKEVEYYNEHDQIEIPLLMCDQYKLREFGESGYRELNCSTMKNHYPELYPLNKRFEIVPNGLLKRWSSAEFANLNVYLYVNDDQRQCQDWLRWDYQSQPFKVSGEEKAQWRGPGIAFQNLHDGAARHCYSPEIEETPFNRAAVVMNLMELVLTATKWGNYFFIYRPICEKVRDNKMFSDLLVPMVKKYGGVPPDNELEILERLAFEFRFSWDELVNQGRDNISEDLRLIVNNTLVRLRDRKQYSTK